MIERLSKFIICLLLVPFIMVVLAIIIPFVILLPFWALLYPETVTFGKK